MSKLASFERESLETSLLDEAWHLELLVDLGLGLGQIILFRSLRVEELLGEVLVSGASCHVPDVLFLDLRALLRRPNLPLGDLKLQLFDSLFLADVFLVDLLQLRLDSAGNDVHFFGMARPQLRRVPGVGHRDHAATFALVGREREVSEDKFLL